MTDLAEAPARNSLYDRDFYEWTQEQARLLRAGRFADLDLENLVEEVESVGRSNKQEIRNRLAIIVEHLLKWEFQPDKRKYGWRSTLSEQRDSVEGVIEDSPSLAGHPSFVLQRAYRVGRSRAASDTGLPESIFPTECPYTVEQICDRLFWPGPVETEIV